MLSPQAQQDTGSWVDRLLDRVFTLNAPKINKSSDENSRDNHMAENQPRGGGGLKNHNFSPQQSPQTPIRRKRTVDGDVKEPAHPRNEARKKNGRSIESRPGNGGSAKAEYVRNRLYTLYLGDRFDRSLIVLRTAWNPPRRLDADDSTIDTANLLIQLSGAIERVEAGMSKI
jgi:hypothetical protein